MLREWYIRFPKSLALEIQSLVENAKNKNLHDNRQKYKDGDYLCKNILKNWATNKSKKVRFWLMSPKSCRKQVHVCQYIVVYVYRLTVLSES